MRDAGRSGRPTRLFDGVCNLCSWAVQFLGLRDCGGSLWYAAMQSATGQAILEYHRLPVNEYDSFLLFEDGHLYAKPEGFSAWCATCASRGLYSASE
jgi:predicted DCC family thiol-disulfide oxidoreductase YuxK